MWAVQFQAEGIVQTIAKNEDDPRQVLRRGEKSRVAVCGKEEDMLGWDCVEEAKGTDYF